VRIFLRKAGKETLLFPSARDQKGGGKRKEKDLPSGRDLRNGIPDISHNKPRGEGEERTETLLPEKQREEGRKKGGGKDLLRVGQKGKGINHPLQKELNQVYLRITSRRGNAPREKKKEGHKTKKSPFFISLKKKKKRWKVPGPSIPLVKRQRKEGYKSIQRRRKEVRDVRLACEREKGRASSIGANPPSSTTFTNQSRERTPHSPSSQRKKKGKRKQKEGGKKGERQASYKQWAHDTGTAKLYLPLLTL